MSVSLTKGSRVNLQKIASDAGVSLSKVVVGLGWDVNRYDGGHAFDLDASAFLLNSNDKVDGDKNFIFYGNKDGKGVKHTGDNLTGDGDGDDEQIIVDLNAVDANVSSIAFTVTIYDADKRSQNFGMVENAYIRIFDADTNQELIRYDLGEDFSVETAVVVGKLYRADGTWKFSAIGSGFSGGLEALCNSYGVQV